MSTNPENPKVDFFFFKEQKWFKEIEQMRKIALASGLREELKWGVPCYCLGERNVVLIHVFKEYCAFLFFKGALLKDTEKILIQQTQNVQSARQIRFTSLQEINKLLPVLKRYIFEAIEVEKAGLKVPLKKTEEYPIPEEFQSKLKQNKNLFKAFYALTPGRQRAYLLHFSSAAQAKTRLARIEKFIPKIMDGKGILD